jgi:Mce-associated membrane protein
VSEAALADEPTPSVRWNLTDLVLAQLVVIALVLTAAVLLWGARALPWTTSAERAGTDARDATTAAKRAVTAFLDVDYRDIDDDSQRVINLSTSPFREQYAGSSTDLRVQTLRAKSVSTATIRVAGVKDVKGDRARVLIGADTVLRTSATRRNRADQSCPHSGARCNRYRFLVTMTHVGDRWLLSHLAEVP